MKMLVIYDSECKKKVDHLREEVAARFGKDSVVRLRRTQTRKYLFSHAWHKDAKKMMKGADIIVYAVSKHSSANKNVEWELRKALKLKKYIICIPMEKDLKPTNKCLYEEDIYTKEYKCLADMVPSKEALFKIIEGFDSNSHIPLFHDKMDDGVLLEQYKIFSETAENLVTRRQSANSFYISANTALITIGGSVIAIDAAGYFLTKLAAIFALTIPGILLNVSWSRMLRSYYINNKAKMKILSMLEEKLAASLYSAEWKAMKNKFSKEKYVSFTENEKKLPISFLLFFIMTELACISGFVWGLLR